MCNTTVQHIQPLNTYSAGPSAHWVTLAVKSLTTDTHKCMILLDIWHSVGDEYVKLSTLNVNVGRSCKTSVNT